jgi:DNA-binding CsgD family transcriptional regulator
LQLALIDGGPACAPASMLDCAAHMLLYFDAQEAVHRIALRFLLERFQASRTHLGYGHPSMRSYLCSSTETLADLGIPIPQRPIPNDLEVIQRVWRSSEPVCFDPNDIPGFEKIWVAAQTKAKLACRMEFEDQIFGMVCIDDTVSARTWQPSDVAYLGLFVRRFLAPILSWRQRVQGRKPARLTEAEQNVVRLAAQGFTYKEIARALARSSNTVDNQLKSARSKLGVRNNVELLRACSSWLSI